MRFTQQNLGRRFCQWDIFRSHVFGSCPFSGGISVAVYSLFVAAPSECGVIVFGLCFMVYFLEAFILLSASC